MASPSPSSVLVLHGPNLNLLGSREPAVYGRTSLAEVNRLLERHAASRGARVSLPAVQPRGPAGGLDPGAAGEGFGAVVINPGASTHYSSGPSRRDRGRDPAGGGGAPLEHPWPRGVPASFRDGGAGGRPDLRVRPARATCWGWTPPSTCSPAGALAPSTGFAARPHGRRGECRASPRRPINRVMGAGASRRALGRDHWRRTVSLFRTRRS